MKWPNNFRSTRQSKLSTSKPCDCDEIDGTRFVEKQDPQIQNNVIYFWDVVNASSTLKLARQIDEANRSIRDIQLNFGEEIIIPIHIHINSPGGDLMPAMALSDKILHNPIPIYTYCEGEVASAATIISVVGKKRFITKNSCVLIHQLSSDTWGTYQEIKEDIQNLDLLMGLIRGVYQKNTKMDLKMIEEILNHNLYMNSDAALSHGVVDEVL